MRIVGVDNQVLGRQFYPYLQAVLTDLYNDQGERLLYGIDPLFVNPLEKLDERWDARQIRPQMENNGPAS